MGFLKTNRDNGEEYSRTFSYVQCVSETVVEWIEEDIIQAGVVVVCTLVLDLNLIPNLTLNLIPNCIKGFDIISHY